MRVFHAVSNDGLSHLGGCLTVLVILDCDAFAGTSSCIKVWSIYTCRFKKPLAAVGNGRISSVLLSGHDVTHNPKAKAS
jgi:hypothetical protein